MNGIDKKTEQIVQCTT